MTEKRKLRSMKKAYRKKQKELQKTLKFYYLKQCKWEFTEPFERMIPMSD